ncbi:2Fe-2S iron-sulfur cluster-binding protein [Echinicola rosea]|uniref:(2Fe-2S) ferredoxin n=1 Tax=Echinicola rosea TaxID=1807691 RepID=A0ABQ1V555_9BACT|nr:2Fe-2S iron-sulfur cluster-binding protein [Echinicola rosea]GGF36219.1 (2Fe-2S) ferredoxin [Echinicola rosea]
MKKVTYITQKEEAKTASASSGNLMELAIANNIEGIEGDCGGVCSCATCHIHLTPEDFETVGGPGEIEEEMLELEDNVSPYSRLACQVPISSLPEQITVKVAN